MLPILLGAVVFMAPGAGAATGVMALDTAAIAVKSPAKVFLCAVARAGNRLVAVGEHGVIIYSNDNGIAWRQAVVPVSAELTAVSFDSTLDGWAVGHYGVILHTADAGTTWQLQLDGLQVNQLTLAAARAAVVTNDPSPGTTFAERRAAHLAAGGPDNPFLSVWTPGRGVAVAFGAYRLVLKTADGGKTWTDESLKVADPYSQHLYDAGEIGGDVYLAAETGLVFRSTDGGNTFPQVTQPVSATLFGVIGTSNGNVLVYGVAGRVFRSADGGHTWSGITLDRTTNLTAATLLRHGAVLVGSEDGTLYLSHDNGTTFKALEAKKATGVFGLAQAVSGDVIAVGNAGVVIIPAVELR